MTTLRDVLKILRQFNVAPEEIVIPTNVYTYIVKQVRTLIGDEENDEFPELDTD